MLLDWGSGLAVRYLLCKNKDPSLILRTHTEEFSVVAQIPSPGVWKMGGYQGLAGQSSLFCEQ